MGRLKLIKASAGSGKTYRLTGEYLNYLFSKERGYKNILAVTFTNKATEEMKRRVVERLYSDSINNPKALKRLSEILHDYSAFNISTIDRFFQHTMRAFAREIGKDSSYAVELDQSMVLSEAIDNMIASLDMEENRDVMNILLDISTYSVESGESWNFRTKLERLADEIFKESFLEVRDKLGIDIIKQSQIVEFRKQLDLIKSSFEETAIRYSKDAISIIERYGLKTTDFKRGKNSPINVLNKIIRNEIPRDIDSLRKMVDSDDIATKTSDKREIIYECYNSGLKDIIDKLKSLYDNQVGDYKTAIAIISNLGLMAALSNIEQYIKDYTKENNLILIPETTELLNKIIDGSDTPFIYEKIGTRIDHFLLDEFQDTSRMQWKNFLPLIRDSLAKGNDNLIVGDVKQSIYRWRSSDWELLSSNIYNDIPHEYVEESALTHNWRSSNVIIDFNNQFFPHLGDVFRDILGERDANIFISATQTPANKENGPTGLIKVESFTDQSDGPTWKELALNFCIDEIRQRVERGVSLSDITFLVRTNDEADMVITKLLESDYPVISSDSLLISSSPIIKKLIATLKQITNSNDSINNAVLQYLGVDFDKIKPYKHLPLYELCEKCLTIYGENYSQSDSIYINSFLDIVLEEGNRARGDLYSFIKWWDKSGYKKSIQAPEGQEAVSVMTIHKSKGLGIPIVFIPFLTLSMDHSGSMGPILWCIPEKEPFDQLPLLPIKYSSQLKGTIFEREYNQERRKSYIDNLNLAYVAFTRAEREMIIAAKGKGSSDSIANELLKLFPSPYYHCTHDKEIYSEIIQRSDEKSTETIPTPPFTVTHARERVKLNFKGEEFYTKEGPRGRGVALHRIMEYIEREEDLSGAVIKVITEGVLPYNLKDETISLITKMFDSVRDRHWFDGTYKVHQELEILEPNIGERRPDRVLIGKDTCIIDFKFGKKREQSHISQIQHYALLLSQIGFKEIRGFVWYPEMGEIIEV